ncbi:MAG: histidine phosphatase family protein, partial [Arcobacteraceae bacterium]|nr:histidine phosphatase family protein [Arcobacteraceae bacterium]
NAPFMGKILKGKNIIPDIILSSPALRAKTTAKIIANEIGFSKSIIYDENIYEAGVDELDNIISKVDDKNDILFLVGHNPSLNMLVDSYINFYENIPTCGIVVIEFDCDSWRDINSGNSRFILFDYPKNY